MGELDDLARQARLESEPTRREIQEVLDGIEGVEILPHLRGIGAPTPDEIRHVRLAVHARRAGSAGWSWVPLLATGFAAVAAAATLAVVSMPTPAKPLAVDLSQSSTMEILEGIRLAPDGRGSVGGTSRAPAITWDNGLLVVESAAEGSVPLEITTREAHVVSTGTHLEVDRSALGTEVRVVRGEVHTTCTGDSLVTRRDGETVMCLPIDGAGWLGRARALRAAGSSTEEVVEAATTGLSSSAPNAVRGELLALKVRVLVDAGHGQDARDLARTYIEEGHTPRRQAMEALLAGGEQEGE